MENPWWLVIKKKLAEQLIIKIIFFQIKSKFKCKIKMKNNKILFKMNKKYNKIKDFLIGLWACVALIIMSIEIMKNNITTNNI